MKLSKTKITKLLKSHRQSLKLKKQRKRQLSGGHRRSAKRNGKAAKAHFRYRTMKRMRQRGDKGLTDDKEKLTTATNFILGPHTSTEAFKTLINTAVNKETYWQMFKSLLQELPGKTLEITDNYYGPLYTNDFEKRMIALLDVITDASGNFKLSGKKPDISALIKEKLTVIAPLADVQKKINEISTETVIETTPADPEKQGKKLQWFKDSINDTNSFLYQSNAINKCVKENKVLDDLKAAIKEAITYEESFRTKLMTFLKDDKMSGCTPTTFLARWCYDA